MRPSFSFFVSMCLALVACGRQGVDGSSGALEVTPASLDFGSLAPGATSERTISFRNVGGRAVALAMATVQGEHASDFSFVDTLFSSVQPGAAVTVRVRFTGLGSSTRIARLVFTTDSRVTPELSIPVSGFVEACSLRCDTPPRCMTGGRCVDNRCEYQPISNCSVDGGPDAGIPDAGVPDAGMRDAGTPDAGPFVAGDFRVARIAAGQVHACAVTTDAGVQCWGSNTNGQVGIQGTMEQLVPARVVGLQGPVTGVAAGMVHSCAALATGELTCWGNVAAVQPPSPTPVIIPLPGPVQDVAGSLFVSCASVGGTGPAAGTLWCWGLNYQRGLLGDGTTSGTAMTPVQIPFDAGVVRVSGGWYHMCAVLSDGRAYCWGANDKGQLGSGSLADSPVPVQVLIDGGVVDITSSQDVTCAQRVDGRGICWGENYGVLTPNGGPTAVSTPIEHWLVPEAVRAVATGTSSVYFSLFDGGLACVGNSSPCATTMFGARTNIPGVDDPVYVRGMLSFACAQHQDAGLSCWGSNLHGALGDGTTNSSIVPRRPIGLE